MGLGFGIRNGVGGAGFWFWEWKRFCEIGIVLFPLNPFRRKPEPISDSNRGMGSGFRRKGLMLICNYSAFPLSSVNRLLSSD